MIATIITMLAPFTPLIIFWFYYKSVQKIEYLKLQLRLCRELIAIDIKNKKEDKNEI